MLKATKCMMILELMFAEYTTNQSLLLLTLGYKKMRYILKIIVGNNNYWFTLP